jgi:hypothetical protein
VNGPGWIVVEQPYGAMVASSRLLSLGSVKMVASIFLLNKVVLRLLEHKKNKTEIRWSNNPRMNKMRGNSLGDLGQ